ncbi:MAG: hypothetical protein QXI39_01055 [Candidatus Bathyarchaeia archaeon]
MLREEQLKIREDFNKMLTVLNWMDARLTRVEHTLEKLTMDVEDEARAILRHRIKVELGIDIEITSLVLPDLELNLYGVSGDLCVLGEASVRAGTPLLDELTKDIERLREKYPERLRRNVLPVLYVCLPLPELVDEAKKMGIWLLKATQDFCKPSISLR